MIEIRFHGRGGQGAVIASEMVAVAAASEGYDVSAFPYFGVERRGAPVTAFTRLDRRPIRTKCQIYEPDYVVILDTALLETVDVLSGLKESGVVLVNTDKTPADMKAILKTDRRVITVDATAIAIRNRLGSSTSPIVNTAIVGAFARISGLLSLESTKKSVMDLAPVKKENNAQAAEDAYNEIKEE